jgi:eukaryotic-like serine/threonine-protein kinase
MHDPQNWAELPSTIIGSTIADTRLEQVGSTVGPYKLLQQIGSGGFGVVYMAEQKEPVRRAVALKIIKPGMDTGQVIARFESERQALALMDHPKIAKVLDAGTTVSGRPYFVMELVKGVPITEFCDKNHLPPEERLKLFVDICHAIQHAHHKGIIHRDIKPSNVMVTLQDGVPAVKVIDFGIAKATAQKLTEKTLFTSYGQLIGTPEYMSPEQAEMSGLDIDTRSDVYSLGVLLYELLTGTTPLEAAQLREAGLVKMQQMIQETEPPRPSTRLSTMGEAATRVAANRGLDVKRLVQVLSGDLDWIVMKALEKDRARRYATPAAFAEDIQRTLRQEPIVARPPSTLYRVQKFLQRNKLAALTTAAIALALLGGTVFSTWLALRATRAESAAIIARDNEREAKKDALAAAHSEKKAKEQALQAAKAEMRAKDEALARDAESKAVLAFVANRIFAAARPEGEEGGLGRDVSLRQAIESAVPYVSKTFTNQPLIEARLRLTLGKSYFDLGDAPKAAEQQETARALFKARHGLNHRDTLRAMSDLSQSLQILGRLDDALRLSQDAVARQKSLLGPDDPDTMEGMTQLAGVLSEQSREPESLKINQEILALRTRKLGPDHPDTINSMSVVGNNFDRLGRYADAMAIRKQTLAVAKLAFPPAHHLVLIATHNVANSLDTAGRANEALKLREETFALAKTHLGPNHTDTLAMMGTLAMSYETAGRLAESLKLAEEVFARTKAKLGAANGSTIHSMINLAASYAAAGRNEDALKLTEQTVALAQATFGPDHPDSFSSLYNLSECYVTVGRYAEALKVREQVFNRQKAKLGPDHPDTLFTMLGVGRDLVRLGRGAESVPLLDDCYRRARVQIVRPVLIPLLIDTRLRYFEKAKDAAGCRRTAEMWEELKRPDANSLYGAASLHAVTAAVIGATDKSEAGKSQAAPEAERAMVLLKQAVAGGFQNSTLVGEDKDLDCLRARDDFKKFAADLKRREGKTK